MAFRVVDHSVSMFASKAQRLALACSLAEAEMDGVVYCILNLPLHLNGNS